MKQILAVMLLVVSVTSFVVSQNNETASSYFNAGQDSMMEENWYAAAEAFQEALRINPSHAESTAALAECFYALGEFDQALSWVKKARTLARGNMALANLEAFILTALGQLDEAASVISDVLAREPYNKEALFVQAELSVARGRAGDAVNIYENAVRRYPDDRRVLISLAMVLGSLGEIDDARKYIVRAMEQHPEDYRVFYYAAYLDAQGGSFPSAARYAEIALNLKPDYKPARTLLASVRYRAGEYREASRLADESIAADRNDIFAWYLKGMSSIQMNRFNDAISILSVASSIDSNDEFVRIALEDTIIQTTSLEDPIRASWADYHFARARDFASRSRYDEALFEYRRGLRINPYSPERRAYADLLRLQAYPSRYLEELKFLQDLGQGTQTINDAVEAYDSLLRDAVFRQWSIDPVLLASRHWKVAVFSAPSQSAFYHADASFMTAGFIKDILSHDRNISPMNLELRQSSYSAAFRAAREAGADYFMIVSVSENDRDISVKGELFVARTGSVAASFSSYRTGPDRLRNASRHILDQLDSMLPLRAELIKRQSNKGLIDKGKIDGIAVNTIFEIVKQGAISLQSEGVGLVYSPQDVSGSLIIEGIDDEIAMGTLTRNGFFDRISEGDEIIIPKEIPEGDTAGTPAVSYADLELQRLLRMIR
ncbi:MAG: tetratricopeptide repeat protein [Treponema sp.]|jgi:tetratricopeptide (TPR) repeat protein|nr:tetratricopeptide repeat protein [Treponema sp.]